MHECEGVGCVREGEVQGCEGFEGKERESLQECCVGVRRFYRSVVG